MKDLFKFWETVAVRWGDMDSFGHVNNATFFTFVEEARMQFFNAIELDRFKERPEIGPAVVSATCNFKRQVHHPATLAVGLRVSGISNRSFTLAYGLYLQNTKDLVADASTAVAWVDYAKNRAAALPDALKEVLNVYH